MKGGEEILGWHSVELNKQDYRSVEYDYPAD